MQNQTIRLFTTASLFFSYQVLANHFYDEAKVTSVKPVYEYVEYVTKPVHCPHRPVSKQQRSGIAGAVIGGTIGRALSHNKRNKGLNTLAGAIIGGTIGHELGRQHHVPSSCERYTRTEKVRELQGYRVKYQYKGQYFDTFMSHAPGKNIKVRVNVNPAQTD